MLGIVAARSLAIDLPLEHPVAVATPALQQAGHHAHGLHHLGVAQAHLGEAVVARRRSLASASGACTSHWSSSAMRNQRDRRRQRKRAEQRMQQEDDDDIDRRPGQIEDGMDAGAGNELAEGVEVAQRLAVGGAALR